MNIKTFSAKIGKMRKPQEFVVYPRQDPNNPNEPIIVQANSVIGKFDPKTREGFLNTKGSNAKYFYHLSPRLGAESYTFPEDFVKQATASIPQTGDQVGPGVFIG